jgi:hypothetical protein
MGYDAYGLPESQTDFRQQDSALAASLVESICVCVAIGSCGVDSFYVHILCFNILLFSVCEDTKFFPYNNFYCEKILLGAC